MYLDNSILISILLNIGIILAFSWVGIKIFDSNYIKSKINDGNNSGLTTRIIKETAVIVPRLRKNMLRIRKMIKANSTNDETPFFLPQFN